MSKDIYGELDDKPPLLGGDEIQRAITWDEQTPLQSFNPYKNIAQAQREADIKWYEG